MNEKKSNHMIVAQGNTERKLMLNPPASKLKAGMSLLTFKSINTDNQALSSRWAVG